jgi:hypothetical protein
MSHYSRKKNIINIGVLHCPLLSTPLPLLETGFVYPGHPLLPPPPSFSTFPTTDMIHPSFLSLPTSIPLLPIPLLILFYISFYIYYLFITIQT